MQLASKRVTEPNSCVLLTGICTFPQLVGLLSPLSHQRWFEVGCVPSLHPLNTTQTGGFLMEDKEKGMNRWLLEEKESDFFNILQ